MREECFLEWKGLLRSAVRFRFRGADAYESCFVLLLGTFGVSGFFHWGQVIKNPHRLSLLFCDLEGLRGSNGGEDNWAPGGAADCICMPSASDIPAAA